MTSIGIQTEEFLPLLEHEQKLTKLYTTIKTLQTSNEALTQVNLSLSSHLLCIPPLSQQQSERNQKLRQELKQLDGQLLRAQGQAYTGQGQEKEKGVGRGRGDKENGGYSGNHRGDLDKKI